MFWVGPPQVDVFTPPQASLKMHGRTAFVLPQEQKKSRLSSVPPQLPTFQERPLQNTDVNVPLCSAWQICVAAVGSLQVVPA